MTHDAPMAPVELLPLLASAGFEYRRHGNLRVALWDTDFLLNQVRDSLKTPKPLLTGFSGVQLRQYASQHVFAELYRDDGHGHPSKWHKLAEQAAAQGSPTAPAVFRDRFETKFMPDITFVEMGDLFADHPLAVAVGAARNGKGASDVPTAQLAVLLSRLRPVAYSHDEHLYKFGVAPRPETLPSVHGAEHQVSTGEHIQVGAFGLGAASVAGVDYLARTIGNCFGLQTWLTRALTIGAGAVLLSSPHRRHAIGKRLTPVVEFVFEQIARAQDGLRLLDTHAVNVDPSESIEARIAEMLVARAQSGPLLAREIQDQLRSCDPSLLNVPSTGELRAVLHATPCFEEDPRRRYSLGHRCARE